MTSPRTRVVLVEGNRAIGQHVERVVARAGHAVLVALCADAESALVRLVDEGRRSIVVDLTDATFIDSTMLRVLLNVSKRLRPGGGELLVVCSEHNIRKIFEITLLDRAILNLREKTSEGELAELNSLRAHMRGSLD